MHAIYSKKPSWTNHCRHQPESFLCNVKHRRCDYDLYVYKDRLGQQSLCVRCGEGLTEIIEFTPLLEFWLRYSKPTDPQPSLTSSAVILEALKAAGQFEFVPNKYWSKG